MSFKQRPYQVDIVNKVRDLMRQGTRRVLIQSPTGSGKTALTAHMIATAVSRGLTCWFNVHRRELIKQSAKAFCLENIKHGVVSSGFDEHKNALAQISSIQTLVKRFKRLRAPKLIVWDEAHHIAAGSWSKIFAAFPEAFHIGLTATPERLDGKGLKDWFDEIVSGPSVSWLIENNYLSPYRIYAPGGIQTDKIHTRMGDYAKSELALAADTPTITGNAITHYLKHAPGKRAVVFCVSIEHSQHVVGQFRAAGIKAAHVDGETNVNERDSAVKDFESGKISILSNVDLFGEGFDLPSIEAAVLLRPTKSLGLYLQQCGRALRTSPGKTEAIILDHAGNCQRHGLPDEERGWTLDGRGERKSNNNAASIKICPNCFAAQFSGLQKCRLCGFIFEGEGRKVTEVEGELVEVDPAIVRRNRMREQGRADSLDDLIRIGKKRGYRNPYAWAHHVFQARQAKRLAQGRVA